ncbi:hypothetical protein [Lysobacter enzymogenes]|uniref:hypothetical protein n=1 Tax=Lysobacter enzymogenes TaxID=69 RepID=UPI001A9567AA|nr:hypothetical protein [Lysobacter enzymogenes]QQP95667.1 hypothetical protein JHW38_20930 [Lysobacter enzymogenes]
MALIRVAACAAALLVAFAAQAAPPPWARGPAPSYEPSELGGGAWASTTGQQVLVDQVIRYCVTRFPQLDGELGKAGGRWLARNARWLRAGERVRVDMKAHLTKNGTVDLDKWRGLERLMSDAYAARIATIEKRMASDPEAAGHCANLGASLDAGKLDVDYNQDAQIMSLLRSYKE